MWRPGLRSEHRARRKPESRTVDTGRQHMMTTRGTNREQALGVAALGERQEPFELAHLVAAVRQCALAVVLDPEVAARLASKLDFSQGRGIAPEPERVVIDPEDTLTFHLAKTGCALHEFSGGTFLPETWGLVTCSLLELYRPGPPTSRQPYEES